MITGNVDRLSDDELELLTWALSLDIEGDMGSHSPMGGALERAAVGRRPVRHPPALIRTAEAGGTTVDVGLRCGPTFVNTPIRPEPSAEMDLGMLEAAGKDKAVRAVLAAIGPHRKTLWTCYVWRFPEARRVKLAAFGDLAPLVSRTRAAEQSFECSEPPRENSVLEFCEGLSSRIEAAKAGGYAPTEADLVALAQIAGEAEERLADACRCVKAALRRHANEMRLERERKRRPTAHRMLREDL